MNSRNLNSSNGGRSQRLDVKDEQALLASGRGLLVFITIILFSNLGGGLYETVDVSQLAQNLHRSNFIYALVPVPVFEFVLYTFHPLNLRYVIAPVSALVVIIIAGTLFVQDIYELKSFGKAFSYIIPSMFGMGYPTLEIDHGKKILGKNEYNPLDVIGGPGIVRIQPGNAVLFRMLRRPSQTSVTSSYFMAPFETIGQIVNLDDQQGSADEIQTITRDGIKVILRDVTFRYRILPDVEDGREIRRSLQNPYPFSEQAMRNMAYNLAKTENGLESWAMSVKRFLVGVIVDFVNTNNIDFLTAPRKSKFEPRNQLLEEFRQPARRAGLRGLGVELIWIDVGHLDIIEEDIDKRRVDLWAAEWMGDAKVTRAYSDAIYQAYMELGRAEAQAEMIMTIAHALENIQMNKTPNLSVKAMMLDRIAQVLHEVRDRPNEDKPGS